MTYDIGAKLITYQGPVCSVSVPFDPLTEIVTREVWAHNCYRFDDLTGRTVVDVGANVGATALAAIAHGADRVIAIEPDPENLQQLHHNLGQLDLGGGWIEVHHAAVGRPGQVQVRRPDGHPRGCCGSSWTTDPDPGGTTVEQRPLVDFLDGTDLLVKIDVEGAEYDILAATTDIDELAARVEHLVLEWHHFPARGVDAFEQLPPLLLRLQARYDTELVGPPERGGLLFAVRR